jgi:hypothetical protein
VRREAEKQARISEWGLERVRVLGTDLGGEKQK